MRRVQITRRGDTIFVPLPVSEWRLTMPGCTCPTCTADGDTSFGFWDTLAISAKGPKPGEHDSTWTVHFPELHAPEQREAGRAIHRAEMAKRAAGITNE